MAAVFSLALILSHLLLFFCSLPFYAAASRGFSADLIHRDSPQSPLYSPSSTTSDRFRASVQRSVSRARHFHHAIAKASSADSSNSSFQSDLIPNSAEYLMSLLIGTPPFKVLAIADTGSDLTWTQCQPCESCYKQRDPIFNPRKSSTYREISCDTDLCSEYIAPSCGRDNACTYSYSYGDGSNTVGSLSSETFTFTSAGKRKVSIPKILFGCSHSSRGTFEYNGGGLVGLGGGGLSLVPQLGSTIDGKFSYCLVPYGDNSSSSTINFGHNARVVGRNVVTTPLIRGNPDTFYFLSLEEIAVGHGDSEASVEVASPSSSGVSSGNIIIDSGTTLTFLSSDNAAQLVRILETKIKLPKVQDPDKFFDLCYKTTLGSSSSSSSDDDFPDITFKFTGAAVTLKPPNTFAQVAEDIACLTIVGGADRLGTSIYGNWAQQNFHVGYDLENRKLSLAPTDCTKF